MFRNLTRACIKLRNKSEIQDADINCVHLPETTNDWVYGAYTWIVTKQAHRRLVPHTKMERSTLDITYKDRRTSICVREGEE